MDALTPDQTHALRAAGAAPGAVGALNGALKAMSPTIGSVAHTGLQIFVKFG